MDRPTPIDKEYTFNDGLIISSTDKEGIITYANKKFCEISNYAKSELVGNSHNILRHPDMPKDVYRELWDNLKNEKEWTGVIKNLRKDGKYYWVYSYITPIKTSGEVIGYTAARRPASPSEIEEILPVYENLLANEK